MTDNPDLKATADETAFLEDGARVECKETGQFMIWDAARRRWRPELTMTGIIAARDELATALAELIFEFEANTLTIVDDISVEHIDCRSADDSQPSELLVRVGVDVRLPR